ncbi:uncharacterized protein LOC141912276 [Tubulanus polymorphus]|uniref:uncharacterized protein LOC141912276 n=1 Tax=Tubulanus polymorphus TaxID=672921 RepID=UPI003DA60D76
MADTFNCLVTMYGLENNLESKMKRTVRIFEKLDKGVGDYRDYKLDKDELSKNMMEDDLAGRLNREDTDGDGSISLVEYVFAFLYEKIEPHYKTAFDASAGNVDEFVKNAKIGDEVATEMKTALGGAAEFTQVQDFTKKNLTARVENLFEIYKQK